MSNYTLDQAFAIAGMGQGTDDYNHGVLATLGKGEMARTYFACLREYQEWIVKNETQDPFEGLMSGSTPEHIELLERMSAAWAPIQAIIDDARKIVDEHRARTEW